MTDNICWLEMLEYKMRARVKPLIIFGILSVCIDNVNGDVFELFQHDKTLGKINITVNNTDEFRNFIVLNKHALPRESINPFIEDAANATQMLGYAVFFPKSDPHSQPVYVAKKRMYDKENPDKTPLSKHKYGQLLSASNFDHTERQLVVAILKKNSRNSLPLQGILCIYTEFPPCRNNALDNDNYPCIRYFEELASQFSSVKFHIYFGNFNNISVNSVKENFINANVLLNESVRLITLKKIEKGFQVKCCLEIGKKRFQKRMEAKMDIIPPKESIAEGWTEIGDRNATHSAIIDTLLQPTLKGDKLNSEEKTQLFNKLYKSDVTPSNIQYHCT